MPILEIHLVEGRTEEQKGDAARAVTNALVASLGVSPQQVRILITEHRSEEFYVAGEAPAIRGKKSNGTSYKQVGE
ncbi:tautomerase family protein [Marinobacter nauticus]|uniref:tautomerase family protein n=1 Tax=Marinobacter nauticus TaxID=2743 RepID=UPI0009340583|nr:2-hydroxymuconate tautomerase family protein [Marinobacter nauticus]